MLDPETTEEHVNNSAFGLPNLLRPKMFAALVEKLGVADMWRAKGLSVAATEVNGRKTSIRRRGNKL